MYCTKLKVFLHGLVLLMWGLVNTQAAAAAPAQVGDVFPEGTAFAWEGRWPTNLAGKVVLIDFWASWCAPCKESLPKLMALSKDYAHQGLVVVGVNLDEERSLMEKFLQKRPIDFTVVRDPDFKLAQKLGIRAMPTSILVGRDGKIRMIHQGYERNSTPKKMKEAIEKCL